MRESETLKNDRKMHERSQVGLLYRKIICHLDSYLSANKQLVACQSFSAIIKKRAYYREKGLLCQPTYKMVVVLSYQRLELRVELLRITYTVSPYSYTECDR